VKKISFKSFVFICIVGILALTGCSTDMAPENAQVIKIEVKKGNGKASGMIKGPSEYTIQFDSSSKEMRQSTEISLDGRVLQKGKDMVWEDDKGPRITLMTEGKKTDEK